MYVKIFYIAKLTLFVNRHRVDVSARDDGVGLGCNGADFYPC